MDSSYPIFLHIIIITFQLWLHDVCDQLSVKVMGQKNAPWLVGFGFLVYIRYNTGEICHKKNARPNTHGKFYNLSFEGTFWDVAQISKAQNFKNWHENIPWF